MAAANTPIYVFDIVGGPSAMNLMFALFQREQHTRPIYFEFSNLPPGQGNRLGMWLDGLTKVSTPVDEWIDGSTEPDPLHNWTFTGTLVADAPIYPSAEVHGLFNDRTRKGWLALK